MDGKKRLVAFQVSKKPELLAWGFYDWANSGYSTLSITVLVAYLQNVVFPSEEWGTTGAVIWAWGIALSMLFGALLSPFLGAVADANASKRWWLGATALCGATACLLLAIIEPQYTWACVAMFLCANFCFELSLTFYNGFLPELAEEDQFNELSAWGYGLGYLGGGIALALAGGLLLYGPQFGIADRSSQLRYGLIVMGLWWGLFTLPAVVFLRDQHARDCLDNSLLPAARNSWNEVLATIKNISRHKKLAWLLLAFLFYNDGIQTVLSQSSTFALQELRFSADELLLVIMMIQFAALPGALVVAKLADRYGQKRTLLCCLLIWIALMLSAYFVSSKRDFWILGVVVAMVMGGTQSVSRAIVGIMTPKHQSAQFFGFFNFSGKATGFLGPFLFGLIFAFTASARWAIVSLMLFFLVGTVILSRVEIDENDRQSPS